MQRWKHILTSIVDVVITLASNNIPFRGHRDHTLGTALEPKSGNFLNIIKLVGRYDPTLGNHISRQENKIKYLSPLIQNELIMTCANSVLSGIINEIKTAPFFSIILDTTQDISKVDQLSVIFRYVLHLFFFLK